MKNVIGCLLRLSFHIPFNLPCKLTQYVTKDCYTDLILLHTFNCAKRWCNQWQLGHKVFVTSLDPWEGETHAPHNGHYWFREGMDNQ